jgi:hypothetical protein
MTTADLETYRERMSPEAYEVAQQIIAGATTVEARARLRLGARVYVRLAAEAEAAVGQRLRRPHGGHAPWSVAAKLRHAKRLTSGGRPKVGGEVCGRCGLRGEHECLRGEDFTRSGERAGSVRYARMLHEE